MKERIEKQQTKKQTNKNNRQTTNHKQNQIEMSISETEIALQLALAILYAVCSIPSFIELFYVFYLKTGLRFKNYFQILLLFLVTG